MKKVLLCLAAAAMLAACGDDAADRTGQIVLAPSQTTLLEVDYYATSVPVGFSADLNWIVDYVSGGGAEGWYAVDPASGMAGEATIAVQVGENTTGAQREGAFRIVCGSAAVEFTVRQFAEDMPDNPYVTIPDEKFRAYLLEHFDTDGDLKLSKEEAAAITELVCEQMDIASLKGIEHMPNLTVLDVSYNKIPDALAVEGYGKLIRLDCDHNPLTSLSVKGCKALRELKANDCFYQDEYGKAIYTLAAIDLTGCGALETLNIEDNSIAVLDLHDCVSLREIRCAYNDLTTIDFSSCTKMTAITCRNNPLHGLTLDVSMCPDLLYLACWEAGLAGVDVSGCPKLQELLVYYNDLNSIDISACPALTRVDLHGTKISALDLGNCPKLNTLFVAFNTIDRLDFSACPELTSVNVSNNTLTQLDLSKCPKLTELTASNNSIDKINVNGCSKLEKLIVGNNLIPEIDLSTNVALSAIDLNKNRLTLLDVNKSPQIYILNCNENKIEELRCDNCKELSLIDAEHNRMTRLDLRPNSLLSEIYLGGNKLAEIQLRGLSELTHLELQDNVLTQLDLTGCSAIDELHIFKNRIEYLSVIPCESVRYIDCRINLLHSLDLSNNPKMNFLFATENPDLKTVYILENAAYSQCSVDEGVKVFYKSPDDFNDVGGDGWGDATIDPWANK